VYVGIAWARSATKQGISRERSGHVARTAETIIRETTGISEIRYETNKATRRRNRHPHVPTPDDLPAIDRHAQHAHEHGADYISIRRLSELLDATTLDTFTALTALLRTKRPDHYEPSLYHTDHHHRAH